MNSYEEIAKQILAHFDNAEYEKAATTITQLTRTPMLISSPIAITLGMQAVRESLPRLLEVLFDCYALRP